MVMKVWTANISTSNICVMNVMMIIVVISMLLTFEGSLVVC